MSTLPTAAIIGAGSSGIAAAKALHERGIAFTCFEASDRIGGNWVFGNRNGMSAAYRDLHINTSRDRMEYSDFPMPESYPDYPHHTQIAAYFDSYVDHFGFRDRIRFQTSVERAERGPQGGWTLTLHDGSVERFDALLVANGHHWNPRWPEPSFPGSETFPGVQLHAHYYRTPDVLAGKRVVVLGIGNSATDIAVESSRVADETYLAMRRGAHILPKYLFGVPTDHLTSSPLARGPFPLQKLGLRTMLRIAVGRMTDYGLPQPDHDVLEAHPTVSDDLLTRLGHGDIHVKPNIDRFEGSKVFFVDGTAVEADVVVYATGYRVAFPFLDETVIRAEDNHIDLYRRVVAPEHPGLYFLGLIQPLGAVMPLAEQQAHWVADLIAGDVTLPPVSEMRAQIAAYDAALRKRYVASKRHTIQVDAHTYRAEIERERRTRRRHA
jgi:dimethylaniline monooxygenase (N-oxide forming)